MPKRCERTKEREQIEMRERVECKCESKSTFPNDSYNIRKQTYQETDWFYIESTV